MVQELFQNMIYIRKAENLPKGKSAIIDIKRDDYIVIRKPIIDWAESIESAK